jgi:CubicO group peptidase (beta-lactamase class C family)
MKTAIFVFLALVQFSVHAIAQPAPAALSAERSKRIDRMLQEYVDQNRIAGAVALVLRDGKPVYERAVGGPQEAKRR